MSSYDSLSRFHKSDSKMTPAHASPQAFSRASMTEGEINDGFRTKETTLFENHSPNHSFQSYFRSSGKKRQSHELSTREVELQVVTKSTNGADVQREPHEPPRLLLYINVAFFAMCGCLSRIGIDNIFGTLGLIENPAEVINQSFFSNMLGSFIFGVLKGSHKSQTRFVTVYTGLTTGFCGSFTTFAKWNQQLSLLLVGKTETQSQAQVLAIESMFVGIYTFFGSYCVGVDFGKAIGNVTTIKMSRFWSKISDICITTLTLLGIIGFVIGVAVDQTQFGKQIWLSAVLAPFGACIRYWFSPLTYKRFKLPLGTLLVNIIGAAILAIVFVIDIRVAKTACEPEWEICWPTVATFAISTGFCACLTTISTFMGEIYNLRAEHPRFSYFYAVSTVLISQVVNGIINGIGAPNETSLTTPPTSTVTQLPT